MTFMAIRKYLFIYLFQMVLPYGLFITVHKYDVMTGVLQLGV